MRDGVPVGPGLCTVCRDRLAASGACITLLGGGHSSRLCATDPRTAMLDDLQYTAGLGPTVDGRRSDSPVAVEDLGSAAAEARWPAFATPAAASGIHTVIAYPLRVGAARLGVLTVYYEQATAGGAGGEGARADGLAVAEALTQTILAMQAGAPGDALAEGLAAAGADGAEVHQASGMVAVQLGIGITEALVRLRSHAYAASRPIGDVAADVVAHRLLLDR